MVSGFVNVTCESGGRRQEAYALTAAREHERPADCPCSAEARAEDQEKGEKELNDRMATCCLHVCIHNILCLNCIYNTIYCEYRLDRHIAFLLY